MVDDSAAKKHVALSSLSKQVILRYLNMILNHDKRLTPFTLASTEDRYVMNVELPDGSSVRTKGTIDRVDQLNGQIRVVDYKSGQADLSFTDVAALFDKEKKSARNKYALQTILYCLLYITNEEKNHRPTPIVMPHIYAVRTLESQNDTVLQQKIKTTVLDEKTGKEKNLQTLVNVDVLVLREPFMNELKKLMMEVMNPEVPFTMTQDSQECENCAFAALCK